MKVRLSKVLSSVVMLLGSILAAGAQVNDTLAKPRLTLQGVGENAALTVHRNAFGKPCLNIEAASRAHVVNPDVYDNIVSIQNQCSKAIKIQICYFGTESCVEAEVLGQQRKDAVLGIRPHSRYFRYSFKEKF